LDNRRIKVLHLLVTMPVGGAEDMVAAVVKGLDPERFEAGCACLGQPGPMGEELRAGGYAVASLGLDLKRDSTRRLVAGVRSLLQEARPDILHTHLYHPNLYGRLAALGLGLKGIVATVHNLYTRVKWHRSLWNWVLGRVSDYVVVFSPQVGQDVRRYDRVPASRLRLVSPGVRIEELQVAATPAAARKRLGLKGFCLGTVARLEEQKGHEYLLAAVRQVLPEIPHLTLVLVGDGQRREFIQQQVEELGLTDVVRLLGTRRDVPLILRALDLYVQPSRWEGIPLTLLEAMGAGLPVISTRVGRAAEVIRDGECGRLVPPGDRESLAAAILELYQHPEWRREWGAQARQRIIDHYSLDTMLRQFADLYLELYTRGARQ
jgi:glycosyltransferase involved in cell wall biosynthesis